MQTLLFLRGGGQAVAQGQRQNMGWICSMTGEGGELISNNRMG